MFNIGAGELVFILVAALIVLGPQRLPEFARSIGRFIREFRRQTDEVRTTVEREFYRMDQEFLEEPRPKSPPPIPASLPMGDAPAASSPVEAEPGVPSAVGEAAGEPGGTSEPEATSAGVSSLEQEAGVRLEPVPGTVARRGPQGG